MGLTKSTIWYILKIKESTDELRNSKKPKNIETVVDNRTFLSPGERRKKTKHLHSNSPDQELPPADRSIRVKVNS